MKRVTLTWDYEIFFGENYYDINTVLIEPTERLLSICSEHNIQCTFFY